MYVSFLFLGLELHEVAKCAAFSHSGVFKNQMPQKILPHLEKSITSLSTGSLSGISNKVPMIYKLHICATFHPRVSSSQADEYKCYAVTCCVQNRTLRSSTVRVLRIYGSHISFP